LQGEEEVEKQIQYLFNHVHHLINSIKCMKDPILVIKKLDTLEKQKSTHTDIDIALSQLGELMSRPRDLLCHFQTSKNSCQWRN